MNSSNDPENYGYTRREAYEVLAATLSDLFDLPPEEAIRKVNEDLAKNPLTWSMQLELPEDFQIRQVG
jgi:hypothetical protein